MKPLYATRIHIALLAYVSVWYSLAWQGITRVDPLVPLASFFLIWSVYLENLLTDSREDAKPACFLARYWFVAFLAGCVCAFAAAPASVPYAVAVGIIGECYNRRCVFWPGRGWVRLKQVYVVKNMVPALGWVAAVWVMPLVACNSPFSAMQVLAAVMLFLFSFREEVKFDIPDAAGDAKAGIRTLANTLGDARTKTLVNATSYALLMLLFWGLAVAYGAGSRHQTGSYLENIFPLVVAFGFDHGFVDRLFVLRSKTLCHDGVAWWALLLAAYVCVPFPWNAALLTGLAAIKLAVIR